MKIVITWLVKWYGAEALARLIIGTFLEGFHLSRNPKKKICDAVMDERIEA